MQAEFIHDMKFHLSSVVEPASQQATGAAAHESKTSHTARGQS
jgi:hypothetical protein